jgi:hypothetical protein
MDEQESNEIKILIDALKYTSNIIVDLTNKLTIQEEKINILENKLNKIQKMSMENNLKLKTIDYDKLNMILKSHDKYINNKKHNINDELENSNDSGNVSEYIIEKKNINNTNNNKTNKNIQNNLGDKNNLQNIEPKDKDKDKDKIDKLIGSIVKRKNLLNEMINNNNNNNNNNENNTKDCEKGLDFTIKTGTVKSEIVDTKSNNLNICSNEIEQDRIINAQNNDLNKANNILKQIRRRANIRKM